MLGVGRNMKIIIIGNSGSGKTWLAMSLAAAMSAPVVHLDDLFWEPGGFDKKRSREEVDLLIRQSKEGASWVVEGVFGELVEPYLDVAELLVWLDIDWRICKTRLEERGSESKKHLGREQSEEGLRKLLEWASRYYYRKDLRSYEGHKTLIKRFSGKKLHLRSEIYVNKLMENAQQMDALDFQIAALLENQ
jgi:adenylate kinase family enzyme